MLDDNVFGVAAQDLTGIPPFAAPRAQSEVCAYAHWQWTFICGFQEVEDTFETATANAGKTETSPQTPLVFQKHVLASVCRFAFVIFCVFVCASSCSGRLRYSLESLQSSPTVARCLSFHALSFRSRRVVASNLWWAWAKKLCFDHACVIRAFCL